MKDVSIYVAVYQTKDNCFVFANVLCAYLHCNYLMRIQHPKQIVLSTHRDHIREEDT